MNDDRDAPAALDGADVHHVRHDPEDWGTLSTSVIEAVAAVAGVDPSRTRIPLERSVNPDALDELFARPDDGAETVACLVFPVWDYTVVVHADGNVFVHEDDGSAGSEPG